MVISLKFLQLQKQLLPREETLDGIVILVKLLHSLKQPFPMEQIPVGKMISSMMKVHCFIIEMNIS